jgi:hypothetical protein
MSEQMFDSILGYFVLKFGFWHALQSYLWVMLPLIMWSWDKYVFWWPWPYLNLHVLCMMYCCLTEVGLTILLKFILTVELYVLLFVTYSFREDLVKEMAENADTRAKFEAFVARYRRESNSRELPPWVPHDERRFFFLLWSKAWDDDEIKDEGRQRKYRLLAKVYALPTSFHALLKIRVCGWPIACVIYCCLCWVFSASPESNSDVKNDLDTYYEDAKDYE